MPRGRKPSIMTLHILRWDNMGYAGKDYDRGQIIELTGAPNDEKLLRLGYVTQIQERNPTILECGECGAKFTEDAARTAHGRRRHPRRERFPEMVASVHSPLGEPSAFIDVEGDKEDLKRMQETPLYLDKTEASMKG